MDGTGDTLKNLVFRDVKLGKCNSETPKDFVHEFIFIVLFVNLCKGNLYRRKIKNRKKKKEKKKNANKSIKHISSLNVPTADVTDVMQESDGIENALKIPNTLKIHKIK